MLPKFFVFCAVALSAIYCSSCSSPIESGAGKYPPLPIGAIDSPQMGTVISKKTQPVVSVAGWTVSHSGISSLSVYVDGNHVLDTKITIARPDVQKAAPQYEHAGQSGWGVNLPVANLAAGPHEILVQATGRDGGVRDMATIIQVQP